MGADTSLLRGDILMESDPATLSVTRKILLPDPVKSTLYTRNPDLGPKILFFSGGSALRELSRELVHYTHNSIHVVTPFDSGGSSAKLRQAFHMPAIGDVRNRLMALADRTIHGFPHIYDLFTYRLPKEEAQDDLLLELGAMVDGRHPLVRGIPDPMRKIIRHHLRMFRHQMPEDFDLRGASIGNLILTSGYLENERRLDPVIYIFSHLVRARGVVRPSTNRDLHLVAQLENGRIIVGQHNMTGKEVSPVSCRILNLHLSKDRRDPVPLELPIRNKMRKLIHGADLICYPMGSFYTSLVANLLLKGMGDAIAENPCPKVYIPSTGTDPEAKGLSLTDQVKLLIRYIKRSAAGPLSVEKMLNFVLLNKGTETYRGVSNASQIEHMGVRVIECPLVSRESAPYIDERRLAPILVSLA